MSLCFMTRWTIILQKVNNTADPQRASSWPPQLSPADRMAHSAVILFLPSPSLERARTTRFERKTRISHSTKEPRKIEELAQIWLSQATDDCMSQDRSRLQVQLLQKAQEICGRHVQLRLLGAPDYNRSR